MLGDALLRGPSARGFARVLAGLMRDEIGAATTPTAAEGVLHTETIDQIVRPFDGATTAVALCRRRSEVPRQRSPDAAVSGVHCAEATLPRQ